MFFGAIIFLNRLVPCYMIFLLPFLETNCTIFLLFSAPLAPRSVSAVPEFITSSFVKLQWIYNDTATYVESWLISYHDNEGVVVNHTVVPDPPTARIIEFIVPDLVPGFTYNMSVQAVVRDYMSENVFTIVTTG